MKAFVIILTILLFGDQVISDFPRILYHEPTSTAVFNEAINEPASIAQPAFTNVNKISFSNNFNNDSLFGECPKQLTYCDYLCIGGGLTCCTNYMCLKGQACCSGSCCSNGKCCPNSKCCSMESTCCGNNCCSKNTTCCGGSTCCSNSTSCCGSECCSAGSLCCNNECCANGKCCSNGNSSNCCAASDVCCSSGGCCPSNYSTCCAAGGCCPSTHPVCCEVSGLCCPAGSRCVGNSCARDDVITLPNYEAIDTLQRYITNSNSLNRNISGYFYDKPYVVGDISTKSVYSIAILEGWAATVGTWSDLSNNQTIKVLVGSAVKMYNPCLSQPTREVVDTITLDLESPFSKITYIKATTPSGSNITKSITLFSSSEKCFNGSGVGLQILIFGNIIQKEQPLYGVRATKTGSPCFLTLNDSFVMANNNYVNVIFTAYGPISNTTNGSVNNSTSEIVIRSSNICSTIKNYYMMYNQWINAYTGKAD